QLANRGVALHLVRQPVHAVRDSEYRTARLRFAVLAQQKRRRFPTREPEREPLHKMLQIQLAGFVFTAAYHGPERVDHHDPGIGALHLADYPVEYRAEVALQHFLAQVQKPDLRPDTRHVEKIELLLVPQHLDRRLAK